MKTTDNVSEWSSFCFRTKCQETIILFKTVPTKGRQKYSKKASTCVESVAMTIVTQFVK